MLKYLEKFFKNDWFKIAGSYTIFSILISLIAIGASDKYILNDFLYIFAVTLLVVLVTPVIIFTACFVLWIKGEALIEEQTFASWGYALHGLVYIIGIAIIIMVFDYLDLGATFEDCNGVPFRYC